VELNKGLGVLENKIFYVQNFLFPETCELLVSTFSKENLKESEKPGVFSGPNDGPNGGSNKNENVLFSVDGIEKINCETNDKGINLGIDIFTGTLTNIEKTVSKIFNKNLILKSYIYSHMKKGGKNELHFDNYSEEYLKDYSAILYLTDSYSGGSLNFPEQNLIIKPKPGTLITFIGTEDIKHEVQEVVDGNRVNIICFLVEKEEVINGTI
jgi:hypothetical protein